MISGQDTGRGRVPVVKPRAPSGASSAPASVPAPPAPNTGGAAPPPAPPDLTSYITSDPGYIQAKAAAQAADTAAGAQRDQLINQSLINFGAVPDLGSIAASFGLTPDQISAITGSINSTTGGLANQYTKSGDSVLARLNSAHDQALEQLRAQLAGRGMLESGATGVGVGLEDQSYQRGMSDAYSTLLNSLLGYQRDYTNTVNTDAGNLATATGDAYSRILQEAQANPDQFGAGSSTAVRNTVGTIPAGTQGIIPPSEQATLAGIAMAKGEPISEHGMGQMPISGGNPAAAVQKAARRKQPLVNPYTTGQKRFG